ncbi:putative cyclic diguanylate phosphodiesterase (EAL) domain protein, partial [Salmonella enterica subsp. enterica serovar Typhimurium str. LT2-4_delta.ramA::kan]
RRYRDPGAGGAPAGRGGDYLQGWHCGAPMPFGLFHFRLTQKASRPLVKLCAQESFL